MTTALLTFYVLMWPVLVAIVLIVIATGFYQDWKEAREQGITMV